MSASGDVCVAQVLDFTDRKTVGASAEGSVVSHSRAHKKQTLPSSTRTSEAKKQKLASQVKASAGTLGKLDECITSRCQQGA